LPQISDHAQRALARVSTVVFVDAPAQLAGTIPQLFEQPEHLIVHRVIGADLEPVSATTDGAGRVGARRAQALADGLHDGLEVIEDGRLPARGGAERQHELLGA
jgi:hypothetical protein